MEELKRILTSNQPATSSKKGKKRSVRKGLYVCLGMCVCALASSQHVPMHPYTTNL
jgi:hypothetical protein